MKEIILKIIDENTYDIEAQCGTRYDAINIETDELAELITKALDNLTSSSRIIHRQPRHGFYYWVKFNEDTEYEVAYCYRYKDGTIEFQPTNGESAYTNEVIDWEKEPIIFKG